MKTILAPIDFSTASEGVLAQAAALARGLAARVVLVTVVQPAVIAVDYAPLGDGIADLTAVEQGATVQKLEALERTLAVQGIEAESRCFLGSPIPVILEQARKLDADYIVMGSHGHSAIYDLLVGSTTHGVLVRATCPVMIVGDSRHATPQPVEADPAAAI